MIQNICIISLPSICKHAREILVRSIIIVVTTTTAAARHMLFAIHKLGGLAANEPEIITAIAHSHGASEMLMIQNTTEERRPC
jgi:hypothetical protein